jgi:hypothetical protein
MAEENAEFAGASHEGFLEHGTMTKLYGRNFYIKNISDYIAPNLDV